MPKEPFSLRKVPKIKFSILIISPDWLIVKGILPDLCLSKMTDFC